MEMDTASVPIGPSKEEGKAALMSSMLRLNAGLWLAGLVLSFALTVPVALRYERSSTLTFLDGKVSHDFEAFVTREHPYRNPSLNSWAALDLKLFDAGKPGVVIGNNGWLFTLEEFPLPSVRERVVTENLDNIRNTVEALRARGIETVIVPIPAKAEIYQEHVPAQLRSHIIPASAVTDYLSEHKIPWIPVKDSLLDSTARGQDTFFRTETHWTPEGARVAAAQVADWVKNGGKAVWQPKTFTVTPASATPLESDLETYIPVRPIFADLLPPAESYMPYKVMSNETASSTDALFSDARNPVALVGTSYSADQRWNFTGWLRSMLQTDIDNVSEKAKGPYAPMERFMEMLDSGKTGAKLVIWELPVRSVAVDYNPEKKRGNY